jgi:hypothetical protein
MIPSAVNDLVTEAREAGEGQWLLFLCRRRPAQEGVQPGHQFGRGEGLDQVVIGAALQLLHPIFDGIAGGEH